MSHRWILPILLILFVSAACTPAPNLLNPDYLRDTTLVSGDPCEAPCWQDLIPGETEWSEARAYIEETSTYTDIERSTSEENNAEAVSFGQTEGQPCCYIYTAEGETVDRIWLLLSPQILLDEVIDRYGEPEFIQAEDFPGDQALVAMLYPDIPLVVYAYAESIAEGELTPASDVIGVLYLSDAEMETVLEYENRYFWDGYGLLSGVIDGNFDVTAESTPPGE
jgi:hypothetical protein